MKTIIFFFIFALLALPAGGHEYRDFLHARYNIEQVRSKLIIDQKWVPYPDYSDRKGWDELTGMYKDQIIRLGEESLDYEWRVVKATDYIEFDRSGSRVIMQEPFGENNRALTNLVMAELAEGKGRFTDQIVNGIWLLCEMTTWALSAHIASAEETDNTALPSYKEHIIDLTAGNLGSFLSLTWYFLKDELDKVNPIVTERLRNNLQVRILDAYMKRDNFWWQAFHATPVTTVNNWNPWVNFNVLSSFLLLENDRDKLAEDVYRLSLIAKESTLKGKCSYTVTCK